jgi:peroxiredoxin
MKQFSLIFLFVFVIFFTNAQNTIPNISLKSLDGKLVNTANLSKDKVIVISFWATWCVPCINELDAISDVYDDWKEETNVTLYAVSTDNSRSVKRVKPLVNGKDWDYEILLDTNNDFKRALGISSVPFVLIVKNNKIMYKHSGYTPGAEDELYEEIKKITN